MIKRQTIPVKIAGGNGFGRYTKISGELTYNMFVSDNWLVPQAGDVIKANIERGKLGRKLFNSYPHKCLIAVAGDSVFKITEDFVVILIGKLNTLEGRVSIAENNAEQIAICDGKHIYIYSFRENSFKIATTTFTPVYVCFQDGYFVAAAFNEPKWYLSELNDGLSWSASKDGGFQTKTDRTIACCPVPSKSGSLFIFGNTSCELWTNRGLELFPYQRAISFNIDYGSPSAHTIAASDSFLVWLAINEKSGPVILISSGGSPVLESTEGLNYELAKIVNPEMSYASLYNIAGHLLYQLTFYGPDDQKTIIYDFLTRQFFYAIGSGSKLHPAIDVVFFTDGYYYLSSETSFLYKMSPESYTFSGKTIPRIRICDTIRFPDGSNFIPYLFSFIIEQGVSNVPMFIDLSVSRDGGITYSNGSRMELKKLGNRRNKVTFRNLGLANELTLQLRFWGKDRFVLSDGSLEVYQ